MKRILIAFFVCISYVSNCQELTLNNLQKLALFTSLDSIDTYLHDKGYSFWCDVKIEGYEIDSIEHFFKANDDSQFHISALKDIYGYFQINYDIDTNEKLFYALKNTCSSFKNIRTLKERSMKGDGQINTAYFRDYYDGKFQYTFVVNTYKDNSLNTFNLTIYWINEKDVLRFNNFK